MRNTLIVATIVLLALAAGVVWVIRTGAVAESTRVRVVDEATRALGREVRIDTLGGDPWRGIVLRGVRIAGPGGGARPSFEGPPGLPQRAGPPPPSPFAAHFERITGTLDFGTAALLEIVLDAVNTDGGTPALM